MSNNPIFSVIVPFYNSEIYLDACIQSLLKQSFEDYELVLVNDGSKDNSLNIAQSYAQKNPRIRLFDKTNGGVSSARNLALDNARGQWIVFVDSDDKVNEDYLQGLYEARSLVPQETNALVISGFRSIDIKSGLTAYVQIYPDHIYHGKDIAQGFFDNKSFKMGMPWSKVYDRKLIERLKLRFDPLLSYSEDLIFMLNYLRHAECLVYSSHCNYVCSFNTGGLSTAYSDFDREYRFLCLMKENIDALTEGAFDAPAYISYYEQMSLRVLSCLYRPKTKCTRKERIAAIKRFTVQHAGLLSLTKNFRLGLLREGKYQLFDSITAVIYRLRFSLLAHAFSAYLQLKSAVKRKKQLSTQSVQTSA